MKFNLGLPGKVIWITGLPGSGKTTLARALYKKLRKKSPGVILIDGDMIRAVCSNDLSYSRKDRLKSAYRISKLCKIFSDQELCVVCSTVSLFHEIHEWNRKNIKSYYQIFIDLEMDIIIKRNQNNLYQQLNGKEKKYIIGVNQKYDKPKKNNFLIKENWNRGDFRKNLEEIYKVII